MFLQQYPILRSMGLACFPKEYWLVPQNDSRSLGPEKLQKIESCVGIKETIRK